MERRPKARRMGPTRFGRCFAADDKTLLLRLDPFLFPADVVAVFQFHELVGQVAI
jgi:hypothetical protein